MLSADAIAINRLKVSGDKRSNEKLVRDLAQTSWNMPLPTHLQQAWVLVRQIKVAGKLQHLRQETARELDSQLQHAISAHQTNAKDASAIWFESFPVLLAFLLRDLALGQATHWYWERWAYLLKYPRQEAITRLLCENPEHLVAVFSYLTRTGNLSLVWNQLTPASAKTITLELIRVCQLPPLSLWTSNQDIKVSTKINKRLRSLRSALAPWKSLLLGIRADDGRFLLASCLFGLNYTPLFLSVNPATFLNAFIKQFSTGADSLGSMNITEAKIPELNTGNKNLISTIVRTDPYQNEQGKYQVAENSIASKNKSSNNPVERKFADTHGLPKESNQNPATNETDTEGFKSINVRSAQESSNEKSTEKVRAVSSEPASAQLKEEVVEQEFAVDLSVPEADRSNEAEILIEAGGFFYLLNPLSRMLNVEILAGQQDANAWHWLFDLYRIFKIQFPRLNTLTDDSLTQFILQQIAPEANFSEIKTLKHRFQESSPCAFSQLLFERIVDEYSSEIFLQELNKSAGFFNNAALIIANQSHIDIYYSLNSVRLDLRLAAWDTNPGWLPWLGRVVNIHYLEKNILAGNKKQFLEGTTDNEISVDDGCNDRGSS